MNSTPSRIPLSAWISPDDDQALDEVLGHYHRANRHLIAIAAIRAGLLLLREQPERVLDLIGDQRAASKVRLRNPEP